MEAHFNPIDAATVVRTLAHFLWQGTAVWCVVVALMWIARPRQSQTRYAIYCAMLAVLAACPIMTLMWSSGQSEARARRGSLEAVAASDIAVATIRESPYARPNDFSVPGSAASLAISVAQWSGAHQRGLLVVWAMGVVCSVLRIAIGGVRISRIARRGTPLPGTLQRTVVRLTGRFGFRSLPVVRVVDDISQAMAVGIVRPMVLLPAAWVSGLNGELLEAVIAHELTHLRRWDLLANFMQRVVEALLFFHPAVWWCSRRIRAEREMCCDEAAVAALGSPVPYAKALATVAQHIGSAYEPAWSMGIGGSKMALFERIRNVLGLAASNGRGRWYGPSCAAVGAAAASLAWGVVLIGMASTDSEKSAVDAKTAMPERGHELGVPIGPSEDGQFQRAFADHVARHPERLGVPGTIQHDQAKTPPEPAESQTNRTMFSEGMPAPASPEVVEQAPNEHSKTLLPPYTIEPPDVLFIEALRVVPKAPYHVQPGDELQVIADPPEANLAARGFFVDPRGRIDLGPRYGKIDVRGLTTDEAEVAVEEFLEPRFSECAVSVTLVQGKAMQPITGEHLVAPDGAVTLGMYGQVSVAGLTLDAAKAKIEDHLGVTRRSLCRGAPV